jgi:hypothetical protein
LVSGTPSVASMAQARGKSEKGEPQKVTFAAATLRYLEALVPCGTHGESVNDVIRTMVRDGIRAAIRDNVISVMKDE